MKIIILMILVSNLLFNMCYAQPHNWQWIYSSDEYGEYIDLSSITTQKNDSDKVISADIWLKIKYSYQGAKKDIDLYQINRHRSESMKITPENIEKGYALHKLHFDFKNDIVTRSHLVIYDNDYNIVYNDGEILEYPIAIWEKYWNTYAYTISYITGDETFIICQDLDNYILNNSSEVMVPLWLVRVEYGYIKETGILLEDGEKPFVFWIEYNYDKTASKKIKIYNKNSNFKYQILDDKFESFIPGSFGERVKDRILSLLEKYPRFANHYKKGGLEPKDQFTIR